MSRVRTNLTGMFAILALTACASGLDAADPSPQIITDGDVEMTITATPSQAPVATPITLRIEIEAPDRTSIFPPMHKGTVINKTLGRFSVTDRAAPTIVPSAGGRQTRIYQYVIETLSSGLHTIPSLSVAYQLPGMTTGPKPIVSEPIDVMIESLLDPISDPTQFRDLKGPVTARPAAPTSSSNVPIAIASLAAFAGLLIAVFRYRRRQPIAADTWAIAEIERIESQSGKRPGRANPMDELAATVRRFIEYNQQTPATAMSSAELMQVAKQSDWPADAVITLDQFTREIDRQKFSGEEISNDASINQWCERIRSMVQTIARAENAGTAAPKEVQ
ncbi:hypothetical protein [Rubripirellula reticaptiva]|uniref:Protein BatD n=1 Tax=Rubripirellula reticaptiva TaxID=2528013 RepID=A0A5C6ESC7_9BACT|nr:hypothetical protein [Rubripirellula reticaptiva]TWU51220.1 hypothetical protein Poly59_28110 [Rubripirellula reticaptiva]